MRRAVKIKLQHVRPTRYEVMKQYRTNEACKPSFYAMQTFANFNEFYEF